MSARDAYGAMSDTSRLTYTPGAQRDSNSDRVSLADIGAVAGAVLFAMSGTIAVAAGLYILLFVQT